MGPMTARPMVETPHEDYGFGRHMTADEILSRARRDPDFLDRCLADPAHLTERYILDAHDAVKLRRELLNMKERKGDTGIL